METLPYCLWWKNVRKLRVSHDVPVEHQKRACWTDPFSQMNLLSEYQTYIKLALYLAADIILPDSHKHTFRFFSLPDTKLVRTLGLNVF